jgi:hypothetical protein
MTGEGGIFSTCTVESGSKKERVVMLFDPPLCLRRRLVDDELERVETGGFGRATSEMTRMLLGRCNKRLLRPSTTLGLLLFFGDEGMDCGEAWSERLWSRSMLGMQRDGLVGPFSKVEGRKERGVCRGREGARKEKKERERFQYN